MARYMDSVLLITLLYQPMAVMPIYIEPWLNMISQRPLCEIKSDSSDNSDLVRCRICTPGTSALGQGYPEVELEARVVEPRCYRQARDSAFVHRKNIPVLGEPASATDIRWQKKRKKVNDGQ
jgi:hypothetical protein